MSKRPSIEDEIKQTVNDYAFKIRRQTSKKAYWNATKLAHDLFEYLENLPYVEADNPPQEEQPHE